MLWRPTYETRILRAVNLPPLAGRTLDRADGVSPAEGAMLGAFGPLAGAELGVWRRLLEEAYPDRPVPVVLAQRAWTPRERRIVADATPPSQLSGTILAEDPEGSWTAALALDRPERAFAAVMRGGVAELLMVGLPTEEAWDEFQEALIV